MIRTHLARSTAHRMLGLGVLACLQVIVAAPARAAGETAKSTMITPDSSLQRPEDLGLRAHTNFRFLTSPGRTNPESRQEPTGSKSHGNFNETPASLACAYGLTPRVLGCRPNSVHQIAPGGSKMIAVVDAYHDRTAVHDLTRFSQAFNLPAITNDNFQIVYATGKRPRQDQTGQWEVEESLDIEMAHGMAPGAQIALVEAKSNSFADLLDAVDAAAKLVADAGGGEVSMSWGGAEFAQETEYKHYFSTPGVVFFAATGDVPGTSFPAVMANVVAVGGTGFFRSPRGNYFFQSAANVGNGPSTFIARPSYQNNIQSIVGNARGIPDVSAYYCGAYSNNPDDGCIGGIWIYDTTPVGIDGVLGWTSVTGTSAASPLVAAVVNDAGSFYDSSELELTEMYLALPQAKAFTDIVTLSCTSPSGQTILAVKGWDFCTGIGAPHGLADK
jgi:kumamolisin